MVASTPHRRESGDLIPPETTPGLKCQRTVFLGFPIWGGSLPATMHSLPVNFDLGGKTMLPITTHGGFGPCGTIEEVRSLAPDANFT